MILVSSSLAEAATGLTFHGRILQPNGHPLESSNVNFDIQIRSPGPENCLLFEETQNLNMVGSSGIFVLTIGTGSRVAAAVDGGNSFNKIFENRGTLTLPTCMIGSTYSPNTADGRHLAVQFNDGTSGWQSLPVQDMNFVPLAIEAMQVSGYTKDQLLRVADGVTATEFAAADWNALWALIQGTSTVYSKANGSNFSPTSNVNFNGQQITNLGTPTTASMAATKGYVDTNFLGLGGGTLAGSVNLGANSLTNVGHVVIANQGTLYLGKFTNPQEASFIAGPPALGGADTGRTWYNTTTGRMRYWDGLAAQNVASESYVGAQISVATASMVTAVNGTAGEINSTGGTTPTLSLIATGVAAASYGSSISVPQITVDSKGRITVASNVAISVTGALGYTPVNRAGDTMTGLLVLSADPSAASGAATKQYVDAVSTAASGAYLRKDGTTPLTADWNLGNFHISGLLDPTSASYAATKNYVDTKFSSAVTSVSGVSGQTVITGASTSPTVGLATTGVSSATYGSSTQIPVLTIDSYGRVTAATYTAAAGAVASVTGTAGQIQNNGTAVNPVMGLVSTGVGAGSYGSLSQIPVITVDSYGRLTAAGSVSMATAVNAVESDPTVATFAKSATGIASRFTINGSNQLDLANFGIAGTYGSTSQIPVLTLDNYGRVTTASYLTVNDTSKLPLIGGTMAGNINMASYKLTNLGTPSASYDAATKAYVDAQVGAAGTVTSVNSVAGDTVIGGTSSAPTVGLATTSVVAGTYGATDKTLILSVDAKGRLTSASQASIAILPSQLLQGGAQSGSYLSWNGSAWAPASFSASETDPTVSAWAKIANTPASYFTTTGNILSLASSGVTAATYGSSTQIPVLTVDAKGRITSATYAAISGVVTSVASVSGQTVLGGTASAPSIGLATTGVGASTYGSSTQIPVLTLDTFGRVTSATFATASVTETDPTVATFAKTVTGLSTHIVTNGSNQLDLQSLTSAGTYGSSTQIPVLTIDSYGRVTAATYTSASGAVASVGGTTGQIQNNGTATNPVLGLVSTGVGAATYGSISQVPILSVDSYGRITSASQQSISIAPSQLTQAGAATGSYLSWNGSAWAPASFSASETDPTVSAWAKLVNPPAATYFTTTGNILSLASSGVSAATYGSSTQIPVLTVDAKGRITSATFATASVTETDPTVATFAKSATGISGRFITNGSSQLDLASTGVTPATYGSLTAIPVITVDSYGRLTLASTVSMATAVNAVETDPTVSSWAKTVNPPSASFFSTTGNTLALTTTGVGAGTYGSTSQIPVLTVDAYGRVTAASYVAASGAVASVGGTAGQIQNNGTATNPVLGLVSTGVTSGTYGSVSQIPIISVDSYGRVTSASYLAASIAPSQITSGGAATSNYLKWSGTAWTAASFGADVASNETDPTVSSWAKTVNPPSATYFTTTGNILSLASSGVAAATYGSSTQVPVLTVDSKGRITSATFATASVTETDPTVATFAKTATGIAGRFTTNGSNQLDLANSGVTAATYGSSSQIPILTVDTFGRVTAATYATVSASAAGSTSQIQYNNGGSFAASASFVWDSTNKRLGIGTGSPTNPLTVTNGDALINGVTVGMGSGTNTSSTALGSNALTANTVGSSNVALGAVTLQANTVGSYNTAVGANALATTTTANHNTAIGYVAGYRAGGSQNTVVGDSAMGYSGGNTTGGGNSALGYYSLYNATSGGGNVAVGQLAGTDISSGSNNIVFGSFGSGTGVTTGSNNIIIGNDVRPQSQTASYQLNIGNLLYSTGLGSGTTAATGGLGVGVASPNATLSVGGVMSLLETTAPTQTTSYGKLYVNSADHKLYFMDQSGSSSAWGSGTGYAAGSVIAASYGTAGAPGLTFNGNTDTGFFNTNPNTTNSSIGISVEGTNVWNITSSSFSSTTTGGALVSNSNVGTASFPTYSFTGDTGTGWFRAAASTLAAATGGVERMRIDSSGNVGIGTTAPLNYGGTYHVVDVRGGTTSEGGIISVGNSDNSVYGQFAMSGSGPAVVMKSVSNHPLTFGTNNTEKMRIDTAGNVGIGTTAPAAALDVNGSIDIKGVNAVSYPSSETTVGNSIAIGPNALLKANSLVTASYNNIAIGRNALSSSSLATSASYNIAIGQQAMASVDQGYNNVAMGYQAMQNSNTSGVSNNVAIGYQALNNGSNTLNTVAIGSGAAANMYSAAYNVAIGVGAMGATGGTNGGHMWNTAIGNNAGYGLDHVADKETFVGAGAGQSVTTGSSNTAIGMGVASTTLTTGSNNILIGTSSAVDTPLSTTSSFLNIGNTLFGTNVGTGTVAAPAGSIGVGVSSPTARLQLPAGAATTNSAPLKFTSGTNLTTPEAGAVEYDGTNLYITDNTNTRRTIATAGGSTYGAGSIIAASFGTAAAPGLTFNGDTSTGFFRNGASTIGITAGGTNLWNISSSGIVSTTTGGANVTNSNGTAAAPTYSFTGDTGTGWFRPAASTLAAATGGVEQLRIDPSGKVGIGTTSASYQLQLRGQTDLVTAVVDVDGFGAAPNFMGRRANGTIGSPSVVTPGTPLAIFSGRGYDGTGYSNYADAAIFVYANDTFSTTSKGTYLSFTNTPTGTTGAVEQMRLNTSGFLGVGTGNPQANVDVAKSTAGSYEPTSGTATTALFRIENSNNNVLDFGNGPSASYGSWIQSTDKTSLATSYQLLLNPNGGNVGIGTTAPAAKLDVSGDASINSIRVGLGNGGIATNTALGVQVLNTTTTGSQNTGIGYNALKNTTTASSNVAIGYVAGQYVSTGVGNVIVGRDALQGGDGSYTVAIGYNAMEIAPGAYNDIAIGSNALNSSSYSGSQNIVIGPSSGSSMSTGNNNILLGYAVNSTSPTSTYQLNIGNTLYGDLSGKKLGIGSMPTARLQLPAGAATVSMAPLKFTQGTNLTTPEAGAVEYDGTNLYFTDNTNTRHTLLASGGSAYSAGSVIAASYGAAAAPGLTFNGDTSTGFFDNGTGKIGISVSGSNLWNISSASFSSVTTGGALITNGNGTASAPTFAFVGDTGTGWFRPSAGTLAASSNGSEQVRIASYGSVGIGTASPSSSSKLDVNGAIYIGGVNGITYPTQDNNFGDSIAIGPSAMANLPSSASYDNIAIGKNAMSGSLTTSATSNSAIGAYALSGLTSGHDNVGIGRYALSGVNSGYGNTAVGSDAGQYMYGSATSNTAIGNGAMYGNSNGASGNTAVGASAIGNGTVGGSYNTAIGMYTGRNLNHSANGTAEYNTLLGFSAGYDITQGANNIIIGRYSNTGTTGVTTGSFNILIGDDVRAQSQTASYQMNVGNLLYGTSLGSGTTAATGNIGIGASSPLAKLHVASASAGSYDPTSGTSTTAVLRLENSTNNVLDMGNGSTASYGSWIQATDKTSLATSYQLALNPNGGNVGVGTTSPGSKLTVAGTIESTSGGVKFPDGSVQGTRALSGISVYSTAGTFSFTPGAGVTKVKVTVIGGGASGSSTGAATSYYPGCGGGAGGTAVAYVAVTPGTPVTVVVGAGGAATAASTGHSGNNGTNSTFNTTVVGGGGLGAVYNSGISDCAGGAGGTASGGDLNLVGGDGSYWFPNSSGQGGSSYMSGATRGIYQGNGNAARGYGGGGSGSGGTSGGVGSGGAGAAGVVIVEY